MKLPTELNLQQHGGYRKNKSAKSMQLVPIPTGSSPVSSAKREKHRALASPSNIDTRMRRGTPGVVEAATTVARAEGLKSEIASEGAAACLVCPCRSWSNT